MDRLVELFISGWNMTFSIHKQKWVEACFIKVVVDKRANSL